MAVVPTYQPRAAEYEPATLPHFPSDTFALYRPRRTDDLKPQMRPWIDRRVRVVEELWEIEPDSPYAGEVAVRVAQPDPVPAGAARDGRVRPDRFRIPREWILPFWVPSGDLEEDTAP